MSDDPDPLPIGSRGTVTDSNEPAGQIYVDWDNGRSLILLATDPYRVVGPDTPRPPATGGGFA